MANISPCFSPWFQQWTPETLRIDGVAPGSMKLRRLGKSTYTFRSVFFSEEEREQSLVPHGASTSAEWSMSVASAWH